MPGTRSSESGPFPRIEGAIGPEAAPRTADTETEPISPELAMIEPAIAAVAPVRPNVSIPIPARTTADAEPEASRTPPPRPANSKAEPKPGPAPAASVSADSDDATPPRRQRRRRRLSFLWVSLCAVLVAAGVLFLPTNRWLDAAHIHLGQSQSGAPIAVSPGERSLRPAGAARVGTLRASTTATQVRLTPLQPHAFGWVRVPNATYYRVRFFRDGREVLEAHPSQPRLVLAAHWRFHGRQYRLDRGRYRWIVQAGFGAPSAKRYGKTLVIADWIAAAAP